MKQRFISAALAVILTQSVEALTESTPDKAISLDQDTAQARRPERQPPPPSRGELLYLNHCLTCHASNIHVRNKQHAKNINAIHSEVTRWSKHLQLKWSAYEIQSVVDYLNTRYYQYSE